MSAPVTNGVHADIPDTDYHADRHSLSSSGARLLLPPSCPAKFRQRMDSPPAPSRVFDFGHLAHRLVLGKGAEIAVLEPAIHGLKADGTRADNLRATATWKRAEEEERAAGRVPVHVDEFLRAQEMAAVVYDHPAAGELFLAENGRAEVSIYATDPATSVQLRARPDWSYVDGEQLVLVDYKTTVTAAPTQFERRAAQYGYHCQAAFYIDVAILAGLAESLRFLLVAQEKEAPYLVSVLEYGPDDIEEGRRLNRKAIELYAKCVESGEWPGYPEEITPIRVPAWARNGSDSRAEAEALIAQLEGITE